MRVEPDAIDRCLDAGIELLNDQYDRDGCDEQHALRGRHRDEAGSRHNEGSNDDFLPECAFMVECQSQSGQRMEEGVEQAAQATLTLVRALGLGGRILVYVGATQ